MSNPNHVFVGLPALIKNAAASDPIVSAGDNHISGIGFFDAITGGTVNRDDLGENFRNTNFLAVVGTQVYFYTAAGITDPDWTNGANWTELTNSDLTQALIDISNNAGNISTNAGAISNNASGISSNAGNIAINAGNISTNAGAISTNSGNITTLQGDLAQEVTDRQNEDSSLLIQIQSNDTDISNNTSAISSNASAISANTSAIAAIVSADGSIDTHSDVDTSSIAPTSGQILVWNTTNWVPADQPPSGVVLLDAKNDTGASIPKGTPVYVSGTSGASGKPTIAPADSDGSGTYPAIGLTTQTLADGDEGLYVIAAGTLTGLDTDTPGYSVGDALYLSSTPGGLTNSRPTGVTNKVQKVALVSRVHVSNGSVIVMGAGRTNDVPNLENGYFWQGNASDVATPANFENSVANTTAVTNNTSKLATIAAGATANQTDAYLLSRANHTGTQTASTISDFDTEVSNNTDVLANTAKVSADGLVTTHSDVTSAGSGAIITTAERSKLNGIATGAEVNVNADWNSVSGDSEILNKPTLGTAAAADTSDFAPAVHTHIAANITDFDTEVSNNTDVAANTLKVSADGSVTTHSDVTNAGSGAIITTAERNKLNGIAAGAEVNVNADWNAVSGDAQILNKPTLGTAAAADTTDFAPASHTHTLADITNAGTSAGYNVPATGDAAVGEVVKGDDTRLTDARTPTAHGHVAGDITGLATVATTGDSTDLIDSADLIRDTNTISDLSFVTQPSTGTVPYLSGGGWVSAVVMQSITFSPTTGITVTSSGQSPTLLLTSSDSSVTITGSASTLDFTATGGGGSSNQRILTLPTTNNYSGDVVTFGGTPTGNSFSEGALYYYDGANWELAYGTQQQSSTGLLGICVDATTPELLIRGVVTNSQFGTSFTSGNRLYVSALQGGTGKMMDSVPASPASGSVLRAVGYVINGTNSQVMFDPSQDFITFP